MNCIRLNDRHFGGGHGRGNGNSPIDGTDNGRGYGPGHSDGDGWSLYGHSDGTGPDAGVIA